MTNLVNRLSSSITSTVKASTIIVSKRKSEKIQPNLKNFGFCLVINIKSNVWLSEMTGVCSY